MEKIRQYDSRAI